MSQIPLVIPLVVAGISVGSMWHKKNLAGVWKRALLAATVSGILNSVYVLLLGYLKIPGTNTSSNTTSAFLVTSGLSGFLIVITIFLSVVGTIKYKRGGEFESEE